MRASDWRYVLRYRATRAHLWALTPGGIWRSACGRMTVRDLVALTNPIDCCDFHIRKCLSCIPQEPRRKETA